jgi:hypothetical protein
MNKFLMAAIALGLWANAVASFIKPAKADSDSLLSDIEMHTRYLRSMDQYLLNIQNILGEIRDRR